MRAGRYFTRQASALACLPHIRWTNPKLVCYLGRAEVVGIQDALPEFRWKRLTSSAFQLRLYVVRRHSRLSNICVPRRGSTYGRWKTDETIVRIYAIMTSCSGLSSGVG